MRNSIKTISVLLLSLSLFVLVDTAAEHQPLPSYKAQQQQFLADRKKSPNAPTFSAQDRRIMKQSIENLAEKLPNPGIKVGKKAPDFTLKDAFGHTVQLSKEWKKSPLVLVFYRGAWCPFCNLQLHVLLKSLPAFKKYGAQLITVTPQLPDSSAEQIRKDGYPFKVLSDLDSHVMKAYHLYYELDPKLLAVYRHLGMDVIKYNGQGRNVLPVPATFIIDTKGIVRGAQADIDYKNRMEPADIVKVLSEL